MGSQRPRIWAVGGGKGGVGKSVVSILLAMELAHNNQRTVLVDADLGGANLHTMLGIKTPVRSLNDFIVGKYLSLRDLCIQSRERNLEVICGASEILSFSNLEFSQTFKIIQSLSQLSADHIILDLGAGATYTMLDFFLAADYPLVVLTPQPISIQNAYGFIRNAVYRKLSRLTMRYKTLHKVIVAAMDPKNDARIRTVGDLYEAIRVTHGATVATRLRNAMAPFRPLLITNRVQTHRERTAGDIIQTVAEKYLAISPQSLGAIHHDDQIELFLSRMIPLTDLAGPNSSLESISSMLHQLVDSCSDRNTPKRAYRG